MGLELKGIGDTIRGSTIKAEVAMLLSYDTRFAFQGQANNPGFSYPTHFRTIYEAFHCLNVPIDVVPPDADLSRYKLVIAPALYVLDKAFAESLKAFTETGGTLVVTLRSGVKDLANAVVDLPLPGLLAELFGVIIQDYDSLAEDMGQPLEYIDSVIPKGGAQANAWCDILTPHTAEVVARYTKDYYAGKAAATLNRVGDGHAVYIGTAGNRALYDTFAPWLLKLSGASALYDTSDGLEVTERRQDDACLRFILNHSDEIKRVSVQGRDLISNTNLDGEVEVPPKGVLLLKQSKFEFPE